MIFDDEGALYRAVGLVLTTLKAKPLYLLAQAISSLDTLCLPFCMEIVLAGIWYLGGIALWRP